MPTPSSRSYISHTTASLSMCLLLVLILLLLCIVSLFVAGLDIPLTSVSAIVSALSDSLNIMLITDVFMPRIAGAAVMGMAFAVAGMIIQSLSYNPLATPTILGINEGAILGIMLPIIWLDKAAIGTWWYGSLGALAVAGGLLLLARNDRVGNRLIVIGIAVTALLRAVLELLYSQIELHHATAVYYFSQGDLLATTYERLTPIALVITLLFGISALRYRSFLPTHLDPAAGQSLSLNPSRSRWLWIALAACLSGTAVGVAGPVAYIGLMAPIIARWLYGRGLGSMKIAALVGAILMVAADTLGQSLLSDSHVAVGTMTSLCGGPFLVGYIVLDHKLRSRAR